MSKTACVQQLHRVFAHECKTFLKICESVDTVRSLTCFLMFTYGAYEDYLGLGMPDPESPSFRDDYLVSECMRKNPRLPTAIDTTQVALGKWLEAESMCMATNNVIAAYWGGEATCLDPISDVLQKTKNIIATVLGDVRESLTYIEAKFRFGPGATSSCKGRNVISSRKILSSLEMTPRLYPYWRSIIGQGRWSSELQDISLVRSNTVTFVPKDAKTDRPIAIEPHGNIYVQLGIGAGIRHRLRRFGLDLDKQADVNRRLALRAQEWGLSTVDLSSASDTISYRLVQELLPIDWFLLLDIARSPFSILPDGSAVELEKFSSMGNGFTFELETLIFWALAKACGDENAVAFGDDLIVERRVAPVLLDALTRLGFRVNERKTFLAGRFFESCGVDVHDGCNVRPFYFRSKDQDVEPSCHYIRLANRIRIYAHRRNNGYGCDIRLLPAWLYVVHREPAVSRTSLPPGYGDDGLVRNFDELPPSKARHGIEGWYTSVLRRRPERARNTIVTGAYLSSLAWGSSDSSRVREHVRGKFEGAALKRQLVAIWRDLGPWV